MNNISLYGNIFWILFSLLTCIESYRAGFGTITKPDSGFFPFCAGIVMLGLGLTAFIKSLGEKGKRRGGDGEGEPIRWWNIPVIIIAIILFALTIEKSGFLINTFLFVAILLKVVEPQSWKKSIIGGLATSIAAEVIFNVIFRAQIPSGILGF
ncbi:MAG: tripartite tricarboxylate transporter TctB family protein [Syntrophorhabdaceae bacterium]|nr:tripartite tricarboxylate transporter TctB family protein [Syntrophorhabdaceae bacterium]